MSIRQLAYNYKHVTTGTNVIKNGIGTLSSVVINSGTTADTITLYDATAGNTTTTIAILKIVATSALPMTVMFNVKFSLGLQVVLSGTDDVTICYD